jgi:hypothetical protein
MLPDPASPLAPKYWQFETSGKLAEAIERYLHNHPLSPEDILLIRAYIRQWIGSPAWDMNPAHDNRSRLELAVLRRAVEGIESRRDISRWLRLALDQNIDPL